MTKKTVHIQSIIKNSSKKTGVYIFYDKKGLILYVGKAKNIHVRLKQHFTLSDPRCALKQRWMIRLVADITWTEAPSEKDALIMENQAIKAHNPPFNIMLRDDKTYPYLKISLSHAFPKFNLVRRISPGEDLYMGPFLSGRQVRHLMDLCHVLFKIRSCSDSFFKLTKRPCLEYQLSRCLAPCVGYQSHEAYTQNINRMLEFLRGRDKQILRDFKQQMKLFAKQEKFLEAKKLRDRISLVERFIHETQGSDFTGIEGHSDFWVHSDQTLGVLHVRFGVITGTQIFQTPKVLLDEQYALGFANYGTRLVLPSRIFIPSETVLPSTVKKSIPLFAHNRVRIAHAKTEKTKALMSYLKEQLSLTPSQKNATQTTHAHNSHRALLRDFCRLTHTPKLFECIDISHFQGAHMVGVVVVFDENGPIKQAYRTYLIRRSAINDPAAIKEVCIRRYQKKNITLPEVLLIDGGKGQLNAAIKALAHLGLEDKMRVLSIAKNRNEKYGGEKIYFPHNSKATLLLPNNPLYSFFCSLRDEAHRFSITQQRSRFQKKTAHFSDLPKIPGLGLKRQEIVKRLLITEGPAGILALDQPPEGIPTPVWKHVRTWAKRFI